MFLVYNPIQSFRLLQRNSVSTQWHGFASILPSILFVFPLLSKKELSFELALGFRVIAKAGYVGSMTASLAAVDVSVAGVFLFSKHRKLFKLRGPRCECKSFKEHFVRCCGIVFKSVLTKTAVSQSMGHHKDRRE